MMLLVRFFSPNPSRCRLLVASRCLLVAFMTVSLAHPTHAQEPTEETLQSLQAKWVKLDAKFAEAEKRIQDSRGEDAEAKKQFQELLFQAKDLIDQIEKKAKANLKVRPNDTEALRALLGIMLDKAEKRRDKDVLKLGDELIAQGINPQYFEIASRSDRLSIAAREIFDELIIRQAEAMTNDLPRVKLNTTQGEIVLELFENEAPDTVGNFINLIEKGHYRDMIFHRVLDGFMAQSGGFKSGPDGKPKREKLDYTIYCECDSPNRRQHFSGCISMAHAGPNTGSAQFFLTFSRQQGLDSQTPPNPRRAAHTCFGRVIEGMDVLDKLTRTHISRIVENRMVEDPIPGITKDQIKSAEVIRKRDHDYVPRKVTPATDQSGPAKN